MRRYRVHVGAQALQVARGLPPERAGRLRMAIRQASARDGSGGLFLVRTPRDVAACERLRDREVLLVYDIRSREELQRLLVGDAIHGAVRRRAMTRLMHSRLY